MAIETKEILTLLGVEADPEKITLDEFKNEVQGKYVLRDNVLKDEEIKKKFTGNVFGKITTKAAQLFDLKSGDVDGKPIEEVLEMAKNQYTAKIEELKKGGAGKASDKEVTELRDKIQALEGQIAIKDKGLSDWEQKYTADLTEKEKALKSHKVGTVLGRVRESLADKFTEDYKKNELAKKGFETMIAGKYEFDLDENEKPVVKLKENGKVVESKKTIGHAATPEEIFLAEMEAQGVLKKNNAQDKKIISTFTPNNGDKPTGKINAKAAARIAELTGK